MRNTTRDLQGCYAFCRLPEGYIAKVRENNVQPVEIGGGLYLHGKAGSGKTTMAVAIAKRLIDTTYRPLMFMDGGECVEMPGMFSVASVKFLNEPGLLAEYKATYSDGVDRDEATVTANLANCDLLVVDDLGKSAPTEWAIQRLWEVIEARYGNGRPTVVTSQHSRGELLKALSKANPVTAEAIVSRLHETCRAVDMGDTDRRLA